MLKKTGVILLAGLCFASFADLIDFESVSTGNYSTLVFENAVLTTYNNSFEVSSNAPWGSHSIINNTHNLSTNVFTLTFDNDVDVNSFSLIVGDYSADDDPIYLTAYDKNNSIIGSYTQTIPASFTGGTTVSLTTALEMAYVKFSSGNPYPGSVYWDNITFNATPSSVPEPSTLSLFGLALMAFGLNFRRKK